MQDEIVFCDTTQYQEILENLLLEFNKFSNVDIDFLAWCNANEGVIAFLSVIASFLVSAIAVGLSIYTFRSQKILQTKNAQENARLQRELTAQNNKLQADLQIRQIKLEKYNLLITNWRNLYNLKVFIIILASVLKVDLETKEKVAINEDITLGVFYYFYKNYTNDNEVFLSNLLCYLKELQFLFDKNKFQKIGIILDLIFRFYILIKACHYYARDNFSDISKELSKEMLEGILNILKLLYNNISEIIKELENEINDYDLKNIQNIKGI